MSSISDIVTPTKRLSTLALIMTSIYTLGVNVVWLSFNIFILPLRVQSVTTEVTKGIVLGALAGVAIGIAVIVNIIAGIISDPSKSRFGRRRPLLWRNSQCRYSSYQRPGPS
jgi:MFS family permease